MHSVDRREFLQASTATALGLGLSADLSAQPAGTPVRPGATWDQGALRHVLPTVSDTRLLIKTSFNSALDGAPTLSVGGTSRARTHGRYARRALALLRHRPGAGATLHAVACRQKRTRAGAAVGDRHLSRPRRAAAAVPRAVLYLRGRPRGLEVPPHDGAQPVAAPWAELCA